MAKKNGTKDVKLHARLSKLDREYKDAKKAASLTNEYLLLENQGFLEAETEMEKTFKVTQNEILGSVDISTQKKAFNLVLDDFGPYTADYSRSGNHLLLGGRKGHIAGFDWKTAKLSCEINVNETVRAVKWLNGDNQFFAAAQKKYTYIYDNQGAEVHALKNHIEASHLEYLPYHYLLVSAGNTGFIKYQDVSTGKLVAELRTKLGPTTSLCQNPYNAVIHAGHNNGTVTLWAPSMSTPLVKLLTSYSPVRAMAVDRQGRYMVTASNDRSLKVWDIRTFKELHSTYYTPTPASSISISDKGLVAVGWGPHVQVWKDMLTSSKQSVPYMNQLYPQNAVQSVQFCPYEDILGVGQAKGFGSLIIPGAGEANFDSLEANPYMNATKQGRREHEVHSLLEKLQPEMIALDPTYIGSVDKRASAVRQTAKDLNQQPSAEEERARLKEEIRPAVRGKNSALRMHKRKHTQNVIDQRRKRVEAALEKEKVARQNQFKKRTGQKIDSIGAALKRFS